jgi:hypothetical protein
VDPQKQISELLGKYDFDLVRQRKHKVYRNPDGLIFVTASTPSDRRASHNALSILKRVLRRRDASDEVVAPRPEPPTVAVTLVAPEARTDRLSAPLSEGEWEAWKRQYWHDEKLRIKNERFLSAVDKYVSRVGELIYEREDVRPAPATDAVKSFLRGLGYKSKVLLYDCAFYSQGVPIEKAQHQPVLWASNGRIGVSAYLPCCTYVQHGPSKAERLRFDWGGMPVLFELPDREARRFYSEFRG